MSTPEIKATLPSVSPDILSTLSASLASLLSTPGDAAAAQAFASSVVSSGGAAVFQSLDVATDVNKVLDDSNKKLAPNRAAAVLVVKALVEAMGPEVQPFITDKCLEKVLSLMADKGGKTVTEPAQAAVEAMTDKKMSPQAKQVLALPILLKALSPTDSKWQIQALALEILARFAQEIPDQISESMPLIVPAISPLLCDAKAQVATNAKNALDLCCKSIDNKDIENLIPILVEALGDPSKVESCIYKLAATTFVQQVEGSALSITVPLLNRGFQSRTTATIRMCAIIIENMAKLVERPSDVAPFVPILLPQLEKASQELSDPEARGVCARVKVMLENRANGVGLAPEPPKVQPEAVIKIMDGIYGASIQNNSSYYNTVNAYVASLCAALINSKLMEKDDWEYNAKPHLANCISDPTSVIYAMNTQCSKFVEFVEEDEQDPDVENLCDCKFSLAYGSKVLLNNTGLVLKKGFKYGLVGPNDCGKTTLMRAIANDQVDGFPPPDEVRTVFVEADIQGEMSHLACIDYILADERIQACGASREDVEAILKSVGFTDLMAKGGVAHLSGGWRMKLALARAMLQKADILLLDEPTNHLDVINVKWVENYLIGLKDVTCIMVSHDSGLLDRVCNHIIQIENLKLKVHKGNLSEFVKKVPQAKSYFELKTDKLKFKFPQPGPLEGITSKGKPVMKMDGVAFTYPTATKPQITNVTVRVSLASRAACIGPNGAGKSTMIKLLTGELEPDSGTVWKHPNCRVGYIAQHAFHHIENHLELTPNEYIRWRYKYGEDREALQKTTMVASDEELKKMKEPILHVWKDANEKEFKEKLVIDKLTGQRRIVKGTKNDYEYEIKWANKPATFTHWMTTERLIELGWEKFVKVVDEKVASRASAFSQPLTIANVEKHLENVGLDKEFGTHTKMGALSGGQKVKVVLAAAMWNMPHIVILDEPTNYLDRDSLGALAGAIKEYEGGIVIISHNREFCNTVCPETWNLIPPTETESAKLVVEGDAEWMEQALKEKVEFKQIEEMTDAFGNTVKIKPQAKKVLSRADKKKLEKKRAAQKRNGTYVPGCNGTDEEDWEE